jgi:hypothetical protein
MVWFAPHDHLPPDRLQKGNIGHVFNVLPFNMHAYVESGAARALKGVCLLAHYLIVPLSPIPVLAALIALE